jgi:hypothetical protein
MWVKESTVHISCLQSILGADAKIGTYRPTLTFLGKRTVYVKTSATKEYEDEGADCSAPKKPVS